VSVTAANTGSAWHEQQARQETSSQGQGISERSFIEAGERREGALVEEQWCRPSMAEQLEVGKGVIGERRNCHH
jgi:hypothetical protein